MRYITGFFMSLGNFSIIPCPYRKWDESCRHLMLASLPLVGLLIGGLWLLLYFLLWNILFPVAMFAAIITAVPFILSGFIHLDGFMDCCDAILSRKPLEERQKILKDSRVGAFSVVSVVILFMFFYGASVELSLGCVGNLGTPDPSGNPANSGLLWETKMWALLFIPAVSRATSGFFVLLCTPIGHSQYKEAFDSKATLSHRIVLSAFVILAIVLAFVLDLSGGAAVTLGVTALACTLGIFYGKKQLGGMSGDIAGFGIVLAEVAAVVTLALV